MWQNHPVLPAGSGVLGRGQTGRQGGPQQLPQWVLESGEPDARAWGHRTRSEQAQSFKHEERGFTHIRNICEA